ncbi:MAG: hypothetical protein ABSE84_06000 [Isosphaeraceae bacterium]|jgi:hypothetical protein
MDIAVDNSVISRMAEHSDLLLGVQSKIAKDGARLVVSLPVLSETFAETSPRNAMARARVLVTLSIQLGSRFLLTGEAPHIARCEQNRPWSSTPPLPALQREGVLAYAPEVRS